MAKYEYYVNLDERGEFNADVRNDDGDTVYEIESSDDLQCMIEFGFIKHGKDTDGLEVYLKDLGVMNQNDIIIMGN